MVDVQAVMSSLSKGSSGMSSSTEEDSKHPYLEIFGEKGVAEYENILRGQVVGVLEKIDLGALPQKYERQCVAFIGVVKSTPAGEKEVARSGIEVRLAHAMGGAETPKPDGGVPRSPGPSA